MTCTAKPIYTGASQTAMRVKSAMEVKLSGSRLVDLCGLHGR